MKFLGWIIGMLCVWHAGAQSAGPLVSGPWAGNVTSRTAMIWLEVNQQTEKVSVRYKKQGHPADSFKTVEYRGALQNAFNPVKLEMNGLDFNTTYQYELVIDGITLNDAGYTFTTQDLWKYRKPAPDFTFLTGSCAYFNEPVYDRPGRPYGSDSTIFKTMSEIPAAFNLWLGDSWYTREVDFSSPWGMNYRVALDRSRPILQPLLKAMPQYFIWDDHDYGPNDAGKSFIHKQESREIFKNYTLNPSYGSDGKGIYTQISYSDVDIFMTDNRYFRSDGRYPDSIHGKPNPDKTYFGKEQMEWLKNALLHSRATFKIIASGSQMLNFATNYDCMCHYSYEFYELIQFIRNAKVEGVLFLTGDRHHSEVIQFNHEGIYTLFDVTVSPLTAGIGRVRGNELDNPQRVEGKLVEAHNFGKITITGKKDERELRIDFMGTYGAKLGSFSVSEKQLKFNR